MCFVFFFLLNTVTFFEGLIRAAINPLRYLNKSFSRVREQRKEKKHLIMVQDIPVILTVFAGREDRMYVLVEYLRKLLASQVATQVHVWNFTRKGSDNTWVDSLGKHVFMHSSLDELNLEKKEFFVFHPNAKHHWQDYYAFYNKEFYHNCVIFKIDDDIVYLEVDRMQSFIQKVCELNEQEPTLLFPSIINNGVTAHYQQQAGLLPDSLGTFELPTIYGTLWESADRATALHQYFVENKVSVFDAKRPTGLVQVPLMHRFSIQFFGIHGKHWHVIAPPWIDDEYALSVLLPSQGKLRLFIDENIYAAHLSFGRQETGGFDIRKVSAWYNTLSFNKNMLQRMSIQQSKKKPLVVVGNYGLYQNNSKSIQNAAA